MSLTSQRAYEPVLTLSAQKSQAGTSLHEYHLHVRANEPNKQTFSVNKGANEPNKLVCLVQG